MTPIFYTISYTSFEPFHFVTLDGLDDILNLTISPRGS